MRTTQTLQTSEVSGRTLLGALHFVIDRSADKLVPNTSFRAFIEVSPAASSRFSTAC
jgi:hypothetical protein